MSRLSSMVLGETGNSSTVIAEQIKLKEKHSAAVIGIDAVFERASDTAEGVHFVKTINTFDNIVSGSRYEEDQPSRKKNFFAYTFFYSASLSKPGAFWVGQITMECRDEPFDSRGRMRQYPAELLLGNK